METNRKNDADVIVVGGGLVGLATAYAIGMQNPNLQVLLCEKETEISQHQSGNNSGVVHSGLYYTPGSLKSELSRKGRRLLIDFCEEHSIPIDMCGKVVVATGSSARESAVVSSEHLLLDELAKRAQQNGVETRRLTQDDLQELEPHCCGSEALLVPDAGIVDYIGVANTLRSLITQQGGIVLTEAEVCSIQRVPSGLFVRTRDSGFSCRLLVNCAGLYSDVVAKMCGVTSAVKIIPFRGEYYQLAPRAEHKCRNLIYPVPDPRYPFLGVHYTRMIHGGVECGPNAVFALAKEGYGWTDIDLREIVRSLAWTGTRKLFLNHWRTGVEELYRSLSKSAFCKSLQKLVPSITVDDLIPGNAGVRAQAIAKDGTMINDFVVKESSHSIHVLNAPSPGATSSLAFGEYVASLCFRKLQK